MKKTQEKKIKAWEAIGREYIRLLVPNRPSQDECENYGRLIADFLKSKRNAKIMVMGSTPELRRILYTYESLHNAEVSCVDINPAMYKAMTGFLAQGLNFKEKFFKHSWLDTKFPDQYFDLVLGDEVICNVNAKKHKELFSEASRILKDQGAWITRHNFYLPEDKKMSIKTIFLNLTLKIRRGEHSFQRAMNFLFSHIFYYSATFGLVDNSVENHLRLIKKEINSKFKNHPDQKIIQELANFYEDNFVPMCGDYKWYVLSQKESEKELKEYFEITDTIYTKDHSMAKHCPIYVLKKK